MEELVAVGRIGKPVGIHGELRLLPFNDDFKRYKKLKEVYIGQSELDARPATVVGVRFTSSAIVLKMRGTETPEDVRKLQQQFVLVRSEDVAAPTRGSFRIDDLIGCEVVTDTGRKAGFLKEVISQQPNDLWVVVNGVHEIMIPAVKAFIQLVDPKNKRITIREVEGLLD